MDKKLLHLLTIDDLDGENRELAELVGMEAFIKLVEVYGGTGKLYVPQADKVLIPVRDEKIREEYDGTNLYGICKKWELSESTVRAIVRDKALTLRREREEKKRAPPDGQISMYDLCRIYRSFSAHFRGGTLRREYGMISLRQGNHTVFFVGRGKGMEGMQFDAGTWWLAVLLLGGVTGLLCWLLKRSYDRVEKKADSAVPKAEFDKQLDSCKSQIRAIQETYTTRATHDKDIDECRKKISKISEVYLTKEDFYREQAKTERKLEQQNQKLDRVLEILMQMQRKENA